MTTSKLGDISDAIEASGRMQEEKRAVHDTFLKERGAMYVVPDADYPKHWTGYFLFDDQVVAYRHMSNGYELYPCATYHVNTILGLATAILGRQEQS